MDKERNAYEQVITKMYNLIAEKYEPKVLVVHRDFLHLLKGYIYPPINNVYMFMGMVVIQDDKVDDFVIGV